MAYTGSPITPAPGDAGVLTFLPQSSFFAIRRRRGVVGVKQPVFIYILSNLFLLITNTSLHHTHSGELIEYGMKHTMS